MKSPGELLAKMIEKAAAGEDVSKDSKELNRATCEFFKRPGIHVSCGDFESSDGKAVKNKNKEKGD